jgi:hypothetical protein
MYEYFPKQADLKHGENNMAIRLFGDRIFSDQTLYEYLIEFLLAFVSPKDEDKEQGTMAFHTNLDSKLVYYVLPRMGLKRFIFYNRSKKDTKVPVDDRAYADMKKVLVESLTAKGVEKNEAESTIEAIQDLLYGYAAVLKNRSWTAQSLLPIAPELIFCEAMIQKTTRMSRINQDDAVAVEKEFDYSRHNFLARGGEVYYLHILQALQNSEEQRGELEALLKHLVTAKSKSFSNLANWIYDTWIKSQGIELDELWRSNNLGFIPATGYLECGKLTITELINYLYTDMHPISRLEILAKGIVMQVMRMMCRRSEQVLGISPLPWIIDMRSKKAGKTVRKISSESYRRVDELLVNAVNKTTKDYLEENPDSAKKYTEIQYLTHARNHTLNMFKRLGKIMQLIIPARGDHERFSLSEDLVKFLVLSTLKPQEKITFDTFLDDLYERYRIVIGPSQYKKSIGEIELDLEQTNSFVQNEKEFQEFLKNTGFLYDLSDATSIVVNPYGRVELS